MASWKMVVSTRQPGERPTAFGVFTPSCLSGSIATVLIAEKLVCFFSFANNACLESFLVAPKRDNHGVPTNSCSAFGESSENFALGALAGRFREGRPRNRRAKFIQHKSFRRQKVTRPEQERPNGQFLHRVIILPRGRLESIYLRLNCNGRDELQIRGRNRRR